MSDAFWAGAWGLATIALLRLLDFYLPKNRISNWAKKHSSPSATDDDSGEEQPVEEDP